MKIKLGQCKCGAITYLVEQAGLKWVGDMTSLDAQEATQALLAGRELYRIRFVGPTPTDLSPARPDVLRALSGEPGERPVVVGSHGCPSGAVRALVTPKVAPEPTPCPKGRENGAQGAARGTPAPRAMSPRTDLAATLIVKMLGATVIDEY